MTDAIRRLLPFVLLGVALGSPSCTDWGDDDVSEADDDDTTADDDDTTVDDDDSATDDDDDTTPQCSGGAGAASGGQFVTAMGASAWLYVPAAPEPCAPLLLFGHGGGSPGGALDAEWFDPFHTELADRSELRGFSFLVPYLEEGPNIQHEWAPAELDELDAMIDAAAALQDLDLGDVIFAGTSSGGHMSAYYGLYQPQRLSRVAVLSAGLGGAGFGYPMPEPAKKLPFFIGHDPLDEIVPYIFSEALAHELTNHEHEFLFVDVESSGGNHHGWTQETTDLVLDWWLGELP